MNKSNMQNRRFAVVTLFSFLSAMLLSGTGCGSISQVGYKYGIGVYPVSSALTKGQTQNFHVSALERSPTDISWKVQKGETVGTIALVVENGQERTDAIIYTAPQVAGTYHIQATAKYNSGGPRTATATIVVQ